MYEILFLRVIDNLVNLSHWTVSDTPLHLYPSFIHQHHLLKVFPSTHLVQNFSTRNWLTPTSLSLKSDSPWVYFSIFTPVPTVLTCMEPYRPRDVPYTPSTFRNFLTTFNFELPRYNETIPLYLHTEGPSFTLKYLHLLYCIRIKQFSPFS